MKKYYLKVLKFLFFNIGQNISWIPNVILKVLKGIELHWRSIVVNKLYISMQRYYISNIILFNK